MKTENKIIGNISIEEWKRAFGRAVDTAISQDLFSDILFFNLYPNISEEAEKLGDDEEAIDDLYNQKWEYVEEAFKEVFGFER